MVTQLSESEVLLCLKFFFSGYFVLLVSEAAGIQYAYVPLLGLSGAAGTDQPFGKQQIGHPA